MYIDSTVNIDNLISSKSKVLPNFGSEINAFFPEVQEGVIELYNMAGQLVKRKEFHSDKEYVPLSNLKEGMYVYSVRTTDGVKLGGKFLKQNISITRARISPSKAKFLT
ncbi:MAG: T9SS type A sorting domain-containing protein [Bacteroidales bacterium]|nr:T9SS type A sorting domain-containing protein [Bacteroidales bacterium]